MGPPVNHDDSLSPELGWDEGCTEGLNDGWLDDCVEGWLLHVIDACEEGWLHNWLLSDAKGWGWIVKTIQSKG